eukprot:COSAG01_NODE_12565_length_1718_cov_17.767140_3_plen_92_part_00
MPLNRGARVGRTASSDRNDEEMRRSADAMHQFLSGRGRRGSSHSGGGDDDDDDDDDSGAGGPLHTAHRTLHCTALCGQDVCRSERPDCLPP